MKTPKPPPLPPVVAKLIKQRVDIALEHTFRLELADSKGLKIKAEREEILISLFGEIARGMGLDRFMETPVERLDQFAVMSLVKNHDTCGLLLSLVNSFMIAYSTPETVNEAYEALVTLERLRGQVAAELKTAGCASTAATRNSSLFSQSNSGNR